MEEVSAGAVIGIGTDIIEVPRIAEMIQRHDRYFLERVFTPDEIAYCLQYRVSEQHFAARWAAKEAALKALGTGWAQGIRWTDIEVVRHPGGAPQLHLHDRALACANSLWRMASAF